MTFLRDAQLWLTSSASSIHWPSLVRAELFRVRLIGALIGLVNNFGCLLSSLPPSKAIHQVVDASDLFL